MLGFVLPESILGGEHRTVAIAFRIVMVRWVQSVHEDPSKTNMQSNKIKVC